MIFDDEDKKILRPENFDEDGIKRLTEAVNCNDSDVDLCEYNGKTVILYSWGNQHGKEYLALAEYDGSMEDFFKSFF